MEIVQVSLLLKIWINLRLLPIFLHFSCFFGQFFPPGSRSENECGSMWIRIHSPGTQLYRYLSVSWRFLARTSVLALENFLAPFFFLSFLAKKSSRSPMLQMRIFYTKIEETMITAGREYFNQYHWKSQRLNYMGRSALAKASRKARLRLRLSTVFNNCGLESFNIW